MSSCILILFSFPNVFSNFLIKKKENHNELEFDLTHTMQFMYNCTSMTAMRPIQVQLNQSWTLCVLGLVTLLVFEDLHVGWWFSSSLLTCLSREAGLTMQTNKALGAQVCSTCSTYQWQRYNIIPNLDYFPPTQNQRLHRLVWNGQPFKRG